MPLDIEQFLHTERLPHIWCPGCGIGIVTGAFLRVVVDLGLEREKTVVVGGIGCSSRAAGYIDLGTVHSIHGRALAFATGIKMARPDFTVVVLTGDGDGAAIGGNHLIHACRRNIDITCILFNNQIYGMTGGQVSPTMEPGRPGDHGSVRPGRAAVRPLPADRGGGGELRGPGYGGQHPAAGEAHQAGDPAQGFSFIEAVVPCPTEYGKRNPPGGVLAMLDDDEGPLGVGERKAAKMPPEELAGKIVTGILHEDKDAPEFQRATRPSSSRRRRGGASRGRSGRGKQAAAAASQATSASASIGSARAGNERRVTDPRRRRRRRAPARLRDRVCSPTRDLVEVRFGGSGGQGVILMGVILAMAGARDHRFVVQTQSYGPEARGGYSRSDVIISDSPIDYPELEQADLLVALSQDCGRRVHRRATLRRRARLRLRERHGRAAVQGAAASASRSPAWPSKRPGGARRRTSSPWGSWRASPAWCP